MVISADDLRSMQSLAQQVTIRRPELLGADATVGELAWVWGKGHATLGETWRHRLWYSGDSVVAWGWTYLPYRTPRSDGKDLEVKQANLAWQVHPDHPELVDEIIDWYDEQTPGADHVTSVQIADQGARQRFADHGYLLDEAEASDEGSWHMFTSRDLNGLAEPVLPDGFRLRTADEVEPAAAVRAHLDAWYPSSFTEAAFADVRRTWPYRGHLHALVEAPDGVLVASTIMWFDEVSRTAEFEPVGTHREYRRLGLGTALLWFGMGLARKAGAERMFVACLGAPAHPSARGLYHGVGFRELTRDVPLIKKR
jgi:GNAT superfamily N-acetyltransferase